MDVRTVQEWLGRESLATTQKYLEPSKEAEGQLEAMSAALREANVSLDSYLLVKKIRDPFCSRQSCEACIFWSLHISPRCVAIRNRMLKLLRWLREYQLVFSFFSIQLDPLHWRSMGNSRYRCCLIGCNKSYFLKHAARNANRMPAILAKKHPLESFLLRGNDNGIVLSPDYFCLTFRFCEIRGSRPSHRRRLKVGEDLYIALLRLRNCRGRIHGGDRGWSTVSACDFLSKRSQISVGLSG